MLQVLAAHRVATFDEIFRSDRTTIIRTPPYTPVANAYAERWVATVRRELLDRALVWHRVVVVGSHSGSNPSQPDDRWMATYPRGP